MVVRKRKYVSGFAVVRIHFDRWPQSPSAEACAEELEQSLDYTFCPIRVLWLRDEALKESQRLNNLNRNKEAGYYVAHTRVQWPPESATEDEALP